MEVVGHDNESANDHVTLIPPKFRQEFKDFISRKNSFPVLAAYRYEHDLGTIVPGLDRHPGGAFTIGKVGRIHR